MENSTVPMRVLDRASLARGLPFGRSAILASMALLLVLADVLPDNHFVDSDSLEFWLAIGFGSAALILAARDRGIEVDWVAWRNRAILLAITMTVSVVGAEYVT